MINFNWQRHQNRPKLETGEAVPTQFIPISLGVTVEQTTKPYKTAYPHRTLVLSTISLSTELVCLDRYHR